jgi:hypothetical protein
MKRFSILAASTALAVAVSSGTALAAGGQVLCINGSSPITGPNSAGQCTKSGQTRITVATESEVSSLQGQVATLQGQVSDLQNTNTTLSNEVSALQTTLSKVSYNPQGLNGEPTLTISDANLQVVNGTGYNYQANGLGNLILGYDPSNRPQTGSHDLVLGHNQEFTASGGIIGGWSNTLSADNGVVFGVGNVAGDSAATVTGGFGNTAGGFAGSISGGRGNVTSGVGEASVTGGGNNTASGEGASVSGGEDNTASGDFSAILGGNGNTVSWIDGTTP